MGNAVDTANLSYNLTEMAKSGIGGVEITPVYGVKGEEEKSIPYLSPEWMRMYNYTQSEAERLNMHVDMNMGTGWPFGGPYVSLEDAATKVLFQEYTIKGGESLKEKIIVRNKDQLPFAKLSKVMAYAKGQSPQDLTSRVDTTGLLKWVSPKEDEWLIMGLFEGKTLQKVKRAAPGGEGWVVNPFDRKAVQNYLDVFDRTFSGSSASYPHNLFNDSFETYGADWTPGFLNEFEKRRGYKLEEYLPSLLGKGDKNISARVVSDYRETMSELLQDNFTTAWTEWAHERGTKIRNQAHGSPGNLIDLYATVDIPECEIFGITDFDIPGLRKDSIKKVNDGDPTTLKYASSAAHITGKKYTSAETFTWLTEHFRTSLSQCKPEIDQMFISGVNHVVFHGSTYSPKDIEWPGWKFYASVDMSPTNSIWKDAPAFFDYIARTQSFLQQGEPDNDFLLYLPIYDFWHDQQDGYYLAFAIHGLRSLLPHFYNTVSYIRGNGYDVDYISDHFIETTTVRNGLLYTQGGSVYKALILPAVKKIPLSTMEKIIRLAEEGATIIFAENYPESVPGYSAFKERQAMFSKLLQKLPQVDDFKQTDLHTLKKGKVITGDNYEELFSLSGIEKESFRKDFSGGYIRRKHEHGHYYFFSMLTNNPIDNWIPLAVKVKSAVFFEPLTGEIGKAKVRERNGKSEVYLQLKPGQSVLLKTYLRKEVDVSNWEYYKEVNPAVILNDDWMMRFVESHPEIKEEFRLSSLGSWTDLPADALQKNMGTARYLKSFHFEKREGKEYRIHLGDVRESARLFINGEFIATLFSVPFEVNIGKFLKNGENTIQIEVTNLPANRIADYDRRNVNWRIFHEINFVNINYQHEKFDKWGVVPSGLLGPVIIHELDKLMP